MLVVYFGHGAPGFLRLMDERIEKDEFQQAVRTMHDRNMYRELVLYLEGYDSSAMMEGLTGDLNMYGVTSTYGPEFGHVMNCPPDDVVHGKHIGSCVAEDFDHFLVEALEKAMHTTTFEQVFSYVFSSVRGSYPAQWGDMDISLESVESFLGKGKKVEAASPISMSPSTQWSARDNALQTYGSILSDMTVSKEARRAALEAYVKELEVREVTERYFKELVKRLVGMKRWEEMMTPATHGIKNPKCYFQAVRDVETILPISDYELSFYQVLVNLCDTMNVDHLPIH